MKKENSPVILVLVMALISFMCLSLSVSYSYVLGTKSPDNKQVIETGNLDANITYTPITLDLDSMVDSKGLNQVIYSNVKIAKNNLYSVYYDISIGYNLDGAEGRTLDDFIPLEYVKVALFPAKGDFATSTPLIGPVTIADLPLSESHDNVLNDYYSLAMGTLAPGIDSTNYALKIWLDSDTGEEFNNRLINLNLKVKQEPLMSKNIYNIRGLVKLDGTIVEGAEISLQNGLKKTSTTNTSYSNYELKEITEGNYILKVTLSSGEIYETTFNVTSGNISGSSVKKTTTSPNDLTDTYIQKAAYKYHTTPLRIIKFNNLTTNSNEKTSEKFNIPDSYIITGENALGSQTIFVSINLTSDGKISLS